MLAIEASFHSLNEPTAVLAAFTSHNAPDMRSLESSRKYGDLRRYCSLARHLSKGQARTT
jgi:hypothetical protein